MFSKAATYAMRAVLYLAVEGSKDKKLGVQHITDALDVPRHFLAKVLQQLAKNNLISSAKGPRGGFYLSEENKENSLLDVIICFEGKDVFSKCVLGLSVCSARNPCPLHNQYEAFKSGLDYQLKRQTIRELAILTEREKFKI